MNDITNDAQPSLDAVGGELDTIVQLIHKHVGIRQRVNVDLTGVEDAAKAILAAMQTPFCVQCGSFDICGVSRRLSTEIIGFDDAGADDDHPVKGITMGHIRRWFDRVEQHETAARFVSTALAAKPLAAPVETDPLYDSRNPNHGRYGGLYAAPGKSEMLQLSKRIETGLKVDEDGFFAPPLSRKEWWMIASSLDYAARFDMPNEPQEPPVSEFERDGIARLLFDKAMSGHAQWDEMTEPNKEDWRLKADEWMVAAPVETAPLRLCGYCETWNSRPCGEGCYWSPTDPTIEKVKADDPASLEADALRWRQLPSHIEEFQIDYVGLKRAIDATLAAQPPTAPVETAHKAALENIREAWAALALIRETIETLGTVGALPASEHLSGPTFIHEAEALVQGIQLMALAVPRSSSDSKRAARIRSALQAAKDVLRGYAKIEYDGDNNPQPNNAFDVEQMCKEALYEIDPAFAEDTEIAAHTSDHAVTNEVKVRRDGEGYLICEGSHHVDEPCEFERYVRIHDEPQGVSQSSTATEHPISQGMLRTQEIMCAADMKAKIAALAHRFWNIHPSTLDDMGLTREEFYASEMVKLFGALTRNEPQTAAMREALELCEDVLKHIQRAYNRQDSPIINKAREQATAALASLTHAQPQTVRDTGAYRDTVNKIAAVREKRLAELAEENAQLRAELAKKRPETLPGMIAEVYGELDAEDCAMVDREWARMRGYILPTNGTSTLSRPQNKTGDQ